MDQSAEGRARPARPDLDDHDQIAELVRRFYAEVANDDLLGPVFVDVARVDWATHLPKLTGFWARVLLGEGDYRGNPYLKHLAVHERHPFTPAHFERWLDLFEATLDAGWAGPRVESAKVFAANVARVHGERLGETSGAAGDDPTGPVGLAAPARRTGARQR
ncbi:MAG: group III truncated hemoglobin [Actinomycetota bacterium]|nr:group III truncated hemoglobin [Actinomycetota bacterium]